MSSEPVGDPNSFLTTLRVHAVSAGSVASVALLPHEGALRAVASDRHGHVAIGYTRVGSFTAASPPHPIALTEVDVQTGKVVVDLVDGALHGDLALGEFGTAGGGFGALYGVNAEGTKRETELGFRCFGEATD